MKTMSSVTNNIDIDLPFLPCEILSRIFWYLPLTDRKNVKLICKLWYEGAKHPSIRKNEKLVFRNGENLVEVAEFLIQKDFAPLNLEFNDLHVDFMPAHFWRSCEHKVVTLFINSQNWNLKTIESVIECCINLETLRVNKKIIHPDSGSFKSQMEHRLIADRLKTENNECKDAFLKLLNDFVGKGMKRPNLRTFIWSFESGDYLLTEDFLNKLFLVFPHVKNFSLEDAGEIYFSGYQCPLELDKCLNPALQLESIAFKVPMNGNWIRNSISKQEWASRLKKFEASYQFPSPSETYDSDIAVLFKFFKAQNHLEEIILTIYHYGDISVYVKNLLFSVLEWCPHLKILDVSFKEEIILNLTLEEAEKFFLLMSNLRTLRTSDLNIRLNFSSELTLPNFALNELVLKLKRNWSEMDENFCSTILKHSLHLKHLELLVYSDSMLKKLSQNVINLQTLVLVFKESRSGKAPISRNELSITSNGFTTLITDLLMKQLEGFETLAIKKHDNIVFEPLRENVVHELRFPKLKTFILNLELFSEKLSEKTLRRLASNLSGLETLNIICAERLTNPVKFYERFKYLTHLTIDDEKISNMKTVEYLFQTLPRLKSITCPEKLFFFNRFTKMISFQVLNYRWYDWEWDTIFD